MTVDEPRPERADAARNRRAILDAAGKLLAERGANDVSIEQIAVAAGVGKGTVFHRFGSRVGLLRALVMERAESLRNAVTSGEPPLGARRAPAGAATGLLRRVGRSRHRELRAVRGLLDRHRRQPARRRIPRLLVWTHRGTTGRDSARHRRRRRAGAAPVLGHFRKPRRPPAVPRRAGRSTQGRRSRHRRSRRFITLTQRRRRDGCEPTPRTRAAGWWIHQFLVMRALAGWVFNRWTW